LNESRCEEVEFENYVIVDPRFITQLTGLLKEIEDFLIGVDFGKLNLLCEEKLKKYFKVKIGPDMKTATLSFILDCPEECAFTIYQQNFHETYGKYPKIG
jgi:hypothetical protein